MANPDLAKIAALLTDHPRARERVWKPEQVQDPLAELSGPSDPSHIEASMPALSGRDPAPPRLASEGGPYTWIADRIDQSASRIGRDRSGVGRRHALLAVKDLIAVSGRPVGAGSMARRGAPEETADAPVVARLRRVGMKLVGTTTLDEFAFGVTGLNSWAGTPRNPYDNGRLTGGSSSGSAVAVAEGSADVGIGTDTGGSARIPAAFCGVVGFKPGRESYPMMGVFPLAPTLDHVGVLARSVSTVNAVHRALGCRTVPVRRPLRIGIDEEAIARSDPDVQAAIHHAIDRVSAKGATAVEVRLPAAEAVFAISTALMFSEAAAVHEADLNNDTGTYSEGVRDRLRTGAAIHAHTYVMAHRRRQEMIKQIGSLFGSVDCVIGPTVGMRPPCRSDASEALSARLVANTRLANVTGLPAVSLPLLGDGLPVGLQVMGFGDAELLGLALWIEEVLAGGQ